jgi:hypothetical protein
VLLASPPPPKCSSSSLPCSKLDIHEVTVPSAGGGRRPKPLSQARASYSLVAWLARGGPDGRRSGGSGVAEGELVRPGAPPLDAPSRLVLCSLLTSLARRSLNPHISRAPGGAPVAA